MPKRRWLWALPILGLVSAACSDDADEPLLITQGGLAAKELHPEYARVGELQVRNGCVVVIEAADPKLPLVGVWPKSAKLTDEGVELGGQVARFGQKSRFQIAISMTQPAVAKEIDSCGSHAIQFYTAIFPY